MTYNRAQEINARKRRMANARAECYWVEYRDPRRWQPDWEYDSAQDGMNMDRRLRFLRGIGYEARSRLARPTLCP